VSGDSFAAWSKPHVVTYRATIEVEVDPYSSSVSAADGMASNVLKTALLDEGEIVEVRNPKTAELLGLMRLTVDKGVVEVSHGRLEAEGD
jgi:hypothetical protein